VFFDTGASEKCRMRTAELLAYQACTHCPNGQKGNPSKKKTTRQIEHIERHRTGTTRGTATAQLTALVKLMSDKQIISLCWFNTRKLTFLFR